MDYCLIHKRVPLYEINITPLLSQYSVKFRLELTFGYSCPIVWKFIFSTSVYLQTKIFKMEASMFDLYEHT